MKITKCVPTLFSYRGCAFPPHKPPFYKSFFHKKESLSTLFFSYSIRDVELGVTVIGRIRIQAKVNCYKSSTTCKFLCTSF